MMDAMDRLKLPKYQAFNRQALAKPAASQPATTPIAFGQKTQPMHPQNGHQGDVFIKSSPSQKPAAADAKPASPMRSALQSFVKQALSGSNPVINALQKLTAASQSAALATKGPAPQPSIALQPTSAQINTRNKVNLFAGAAVTTAGLGALGATVLGPAALAANPALLNKVVSLLPAQLP